MVEVLKRYSNMSSSVSKALDRIEKGRSGAGPADVQGKRRTHRHVRLSASQRADVLALYTDGETTAALARQFGVHKDTVRSIVDAAGARRKRRHRMTMADDHVAAQLRGDGGSYAAIAAHFGVAPETIRRRLASSAK